ncbi:anti-sigma factor antagonist [Leptospira langatensis]|uniref:Anti-sigma factor antagonist n=1 Tax=Leptospira langatensis TaxID=2484983 RepID=A0A5F1ZXJ6_9LEPT|nr:STAS domain-containing protein [Leptospira langatensis]TGK01188.1 anti-sigma factor antagonist [Leptospira langatensis]TGL42361.1 anti-sigma factor antagonist [Leptospira langatensis]
MSESPWNLDSNEFDHDAPELGVFLDQDNIPDGLPQEAVVVKITGEINLYSAQIMKERFFHLLDRGFIYLLVNMENVKYIDSSGLGVFMATHSRLVKSGKGGIAVFSPSSQVNKILELTKLKSLIRVGTTSLEAWRLLAP